tara:strand:- start:291 stop:494 length:204 start_codon:yes stop_codon:yes gene_type:complete
MKKIQKSNLYKKYYEKKGQISFFGYDNLHFKTINLPKRQRFKNLCSVFSLKKIINHTSTVLKVIKIT